MVLPDVLRDGLDVVFCGSAVGKASAEAGVYYAGRGNKFWTTLATVGFTPRVYAPEEFEEISTLGLGLTDLVKAQSGGDSTIVFGRPDVEGLRSKIEKFAPRYLCFNGKRAAKEFFGVRKVSYGLQSGDIGCTQVFVAPSTSAAGGRWWDIAWWHKLADMVREPSR